MFHLFVVHTEKLTQRQSNLHGVIQTIRTTAQEAGLTPKIHMILKPDPDHLKPSIETLDKRIKYEKTGNEQFDKQMNMLTLEELSNYEKQREVWRRITEQSSADTFMVIEDDAFILPNTIPFLRETITADKTTYDFLTLALSDTDADAQSAPFCLNDFRNMGTILPSKDAYLISHRAAKVLLAQSETITFNMRLQISHILSKNPGLAVKYPNKRSMLEGSKLGLYPSTIHANNILIYNQEFMQLFQYLSHENPPVREIREIYKKVAHVQNPDVMHIYGVLLYKAKELHEAQDILVAAVEQVQKQQGFLSPQSEILNNAINIHEFAQWDLPDLISKPSKYSLLQV